jgi:hypothetical protein
MKLKVATSAAVTLILAAAGTAFADHNSKNGEGWANMPNDIHNTRIETREANDNEAFRDFVKYGEGSRTENRFATDSTTPAQSGNKENMAQKQAQKQAETKSANQTRSANQARSANQEKSAGQDKSRSESRSRQRLDTRSTSRSSRVSGTRSGGSRAGGRGK